MRVAYEVPRFSAGDTTPSAADVDLLIVPVAEDQTGAAVAAFDGAVGGDLKSALERGEFRAKACELFSAAIRSEGWRASRMLFVGGGPRTEIAAERVRRMAATAAREACRQRRARIAWVDVEPGTLAAEARIETIAEGLTRGNFDNGIHKSRNSREFFVTDAAVLVASGPASATGAAEAGRCIGESVTAARVLINEPGNYLTPRVLAEKAAALADVPGISADILDEHRIAELGMGLLLGVARGSSEPPRVLVLRYEPTGVPPGKVLGLVGKGITFDTGGLSLKPADGMERMKDDMAGGAIVVAAMRCIATQNLPIRAIAVVPMTENMPGGRAGRVDCGRDVSEGVRRRRSVGPPRHRRNGLGGRRELVAAQRRHRSHDPDPRRSSPFRFPGVATRTDDAAPRRHHADDRPSRHGRARARAQHD